MKRQGGPRVNVAIYGRALLHLVRHPSVLVVPLVASVIDMLVQFWGGIATDPLGGFGSGILQMAVQILYLFAFGAAIVQANNIDRGHRAGFDDAWEETRKKAGGILIAAIGFQFVIYIASYVGALLPIPNLGVVLGMAAAYFLIFTMPAASIGGLPGGLAISGSIRAVRNNPLAALLLAIVFVALWQFGPLYLTVLLGNVLGANYTPIFQDLSQAIYRTIVLGYLAFPFAVTYDDIAFKLW